MLLQGGRGSSFKLPPSWWREDRRGQRYFALNSTLLTHHRCHTQTFQIHQLHPTLHPAPYLEMQSVLFSNLPASSSATKLNNRVSAPHPAPYSIRGLRCSPYSASLTTTPYLHTPNLHPPHPHTPPTPHTPTLAQTTPHTFSIRGLRRSTYSISR
jgi:hypothetical protein